MSIFSFEEIKEQHKGADLIIIGNGPSAMQLKESYEGSGELFPEVMNLSGHENRPVWTVNGGWGYYPMNSTVGFAMHDYRTPGGISGGYPIKDKQEMFDRLFTDIPIPIITSVKVPHLPNTVAFPLKECLLRFNTAYFGEAIHYMIAMAIMCGVRTIELLGVDYLPDDRKPYERAGTEYWLGRADEAGVTVYRDGYTYLMTTDLPDYMAQGFYGYSPESLSEAVDLAAVDAEITLKKDNWVQQPLEDRKIA